ncbi:hypothetical protein CCR96_04720 [Halochromatium roseum]|nr:hypothetical protein [Halochromatium roseum]
MPNEAAERLASETRHSRFGRTLTNSFFTILDLLDSLLHRGLQRGFAELGKGRNQAGDQSHTEKSPSQ